MKKWPIAIQVYTVDKEATADFEGTARALKAMGYDGVELCDTYGGTAVELKKICDEIGLAVVGAHVNLNEIEDDAILSDYAATGMKYIAIPHLKAPKTEEELAAVIARIRAAGEACKAKGLQLLYHNHDFEFQKINDKYILEHYYDEIPTDLLQTELDVCWVNVGGEEPAAYVRKYTGRAPLLHLKDFTGVKSSNMYNLIGQAAVRDESAAKFDYRPVGYGKQDVPAIVAAAEDAGVEWLVVEQDRCSMGRTALECAQMSVNYLKSFL